ncbi:MAG: hypothetical protein C0404_13190 [Verrucomicrobia bacterium]|nr:hypothetical protein [Verrucomicrobiota bacterium]
MAVKAIVTTLIGRQETKLFTMGFLILLLELVLIRYLAGNIWNLGYFPNLVLIGVFVGMGLGFVFHNVIPARHSETIFRVSATVLLLLVVFVHFKHPMIPGFSQWDGNIGGELFFSFSGDKVSDNSLLLFVVWFTFVVAVFAMIAQRMAKVFALFSPLKAYTLDISGSCCGILAFMLVSWLHIPAYAWFCALIVLFFVAMDRSRPAAYAAYLLPILAAAFVVYYQDTIVLNYPGKHRFHETRWSPYQRVDCLSSGPGETYSNVILVNGMIHQNMCEPAVLTNLFYMTPYAERAARKDVGPYRSVLIIGAGTGNDLAAALASRVEHVDAVEIDPVIARFGKDLHPARPYSDPRVTLIVDDGRSFMTKTKNKYDIIIFALTDSLVKTSPMAQLRLENYLFTRESVSRAYSMLNDNGNIFFYNYYRRPWLAEKISAMMAEATGGTPRVVGQHRDFMILAVEKSPVQAGAGGTKPGIDIPTDDWPFLYLQNMGIPSFYLKAMAGMAVFIGLMMVVLQFTSRNPDGQDNRGMLLTKTAFVLMGVAFLLLETKSVIQFSLLFGTTWINSSLVFLSVLVLVLLANWTAYFLKSDKVLPVAYALLICSCLLVLVYPLSNLLYFDNRTIRFALAAIMTFSPVFFANLIFSIVFRNQRVAEHLFGWNLLGATLGGVAEYFSMAVGYNSLTIFVAVCYTCVFILIRLARMRQVSLP